MHLIGNFGEVFLRCISRWVFLDASTVCLQKLFLLKCEIIDNIFYLFSLVIALPEPYGHYRVSGRIEVGLRSEDRK